MKRVQTITKICIACPEQYEGILDTGEEFYVWCRWGYGRLDINTKTVSEVEYDPYRGTFKERDLVKLFFDAGVYLNPGLIRDREW